VVVVDDKKAMEDELFHLARVALTGRPQDVALLVRKYARRYRGTLPDLAEQLTALLRKTPTRVNPTRRIESNALPLDGDSRLPLIRVLEVPILDAEPVYTPRGCIAQAWSVAEVLRCLAKTA